MKIPNNNLSFVADNKITDYLLSDIHEIGKHKAAFFKRFGFDIEGIKIFKGSLIQHSFEREIEKEVATEYDLVSPYGILQTSSRTIFWKGDPSIEIFFGGFITFPVW